MARVDRIGPAALIALAIGCGAPSPRETAEPPAIVERDDRGIEVRLASPPRRIVSMIPSHTDTLIALGLTDRIVARDDYSTQPEVAALPAVGGLEPNVEAVVALAPDLVLATEYGAQASALEQAGLVVWAGSAQRYDDVFATIETVGRLTGHAREAIALARTLRARVDAITERARTRAPVRVYFEVDPTPYSAGPESFVGALLARAGGVNVVPAGLGEFPAIAPEAVIAGDPEVIVGVSLDEVRARPGWSRIEAVRTGRVHALERAQREVVVHAGPRLDEALEVLIELLHPDPREHVAR